MAIGGSDHEDWHATLAARKELGDEYDKAFVTSVVERVSAEIDTRVDMRLDEIAARLPSRPIRRRGRTFMALSSLTLGIPLTAIAANFAHLPGLMVAWGGIVLVNVAHAWQPGGARRPSRPSRRPLR
jgi:hypothetical protein